MTASISNGNGKIRKTSASAVAKAASFLYEIDALSWNELQAIRLALRNLARDDQCPPEPEKRLVDLHEVARMLSIAESTLKRLLAEGSIKLPKVKIGGNVRFRLADVECLMVANDDKEIMPTK